MPFREALTTWAGVGLRSFGGPAGQIAVMHRIFVEERRWVSESQFLHALNYCMLLPGPEAQQLAVYVGWLLHGYRGGPAAGILFVLPGFVSILALSVLYAAFQGVALVASLFFGLKAAVVAIVAEAMWRIGRRVLRNGILLALAGAAFLALFLFHLPFPLVILGAGLLGLVGGAVRPESFLVEAAGLAPGSGPEPSGSGLSEGTPPQRTRANAAQALRVAAVHLLLWFVPIALLAAVLGTQSVFVKIGLFFSKAAVVTFGGAYAVLAYLAQQAVERHGWLRPGEMLDGLAMAETTPGPLIMVVQFVGFMAAYREPGSLAPMLAGTLGAILTTWVTFVPCFLWIFLGAPYVESLRGHRRWNAALSAITAAVVGVIPDLAVWFAIGVLFQEVGRLEGPLGLSLPAPAWRTLNVPVLLISVGALVALLRYRVGVLPVLAASAAVGMLL